MLLTTKVDSTKSHDERMLFDTKVVAPSREEDDLCHGTNDFEVTGTKDALERGLLDVSEFYGHQPSLRRSFTSTAPNRVFKSGCGTSMPATSTTLNLRSRRCVSTRTVRCARPPSARALGVNNREEHTSAELVLE